MEGSRRIVHAQEALSDAVLMRSYPSNALRKLRSNPLADVDMRRLCRAERHMTGTALAAAANASDSVASSTSSNSGFYCASVGAHNYAARSPMACEPWKHGEWRQPIVFVHIPKAAGTTVEMLLAKYVTSIHGKAKGSPVSLARLWQAKAISSDYSMLFVSKRTVHFAERLDALARPHVLLIMLRHPAERIFSHFRYVRGGNVTGACLISPNISFAQWFELLAHRMPDTDNYEVRLLVGLRAAPELAYAAEAECFYAGECKVSCRGCRLIANATMPAVRPSHVASALLRLRRMSLIGVVERLEETLRVWRAALPGLKHLRWSPRTRICGETGKCGDTASKQAAVDRQSFDAVRGRVEARNWGSMAVWETGNALFDQQLRAMPRSDV